jgi:hypothetical protein
MSLPLELFRFRIVRPVQARTPAEGDVIDLSAIKDKPDSLAYASPQTVIDPDTWSSWLRGISQRLAAAGDLIAPRHLESLFPADWKSQVAAPEWAQGREELGRSVVLALAQVGSAADSEVTVEKLMRLLRLHDLFTELAQDAGKSAGDRRIRTAEDVAAALAKPVVVDQSMIHRGKGTQQLVRQPGITTLYLVKDEWNRYEPSELARIVNVLPGETFDARLRHREETDKTSATSTSTTTTDETEQSQMQTSSLSQTSAKDASLNVGVQGQVETSGQYGPTHVDTSLGAQLQVSNHTSDSRALSTAFQTVQRSVKTVAETVVQVQTTRTRVSDESFEDHKLENQGSDVTVGLYRWLNEIHRVQVESYPNRFVVEFEIPEPGAWLRWAMDNAPASLDNPDPGPFRLAGADHDLTPTDIDATTLGQLAAQWQVAGLTPPPPDTLTLSVKLSEDPSAQNSAAFVTATDDSMSVPNGYTATAWHADVFAVRDWSWKQYGTMMTVTVGGGPSGMSSTGDLGQAAFVDQGLSGDVGEITNGTIPVAVYTIALQGFTCVVNVTCALMDEAYRQWQESTFDTIAATYQSLRAAYQQERDAAAQQPGGLTGVTGSPDLNKQRVANEMRRLVIEELIGTPFDGAPAIDVDSSSTPPDEPSVDLAGARNVARRVQFMEQAFEWENLVFICYPYYWARRSVWATNALSASADPEFDQFLNSGSARVVVPARPGFEALVNFFLYTGQIWGGGDPPAPNDPDYLSIAQEIQAVQVGATDGTPVGSSWEISLPTTLIWAGTDPSTLPTNPDPTIPAPSA